MRSRRHSYRLPGEDSVHSLHRIAIQVHRMLKRGHNMPMQIHRTAAQVHRMPMGIRKMPLAKRKMLMQAIRLRITRIALQTEAVYTVQAVINTAAHTRTSMHRVTAERKRKKTAVILRKCSSAFPWDCFSVFVQA